MPANASSIAKESAMEMPFMMFAVFAAETTAPATFAVMERLPELRNAIWEPITERMDLAAAHFARPALPKTWEPLLEESSVPWLDWWSWVLPPSLPFNMPRRMV